MPPAEKDISNITVDAGIVSLCGYYAPGTDFADRVSGNQFGVAVNYCMKSWIKRLVHYSKEKKYSDIRLRVASSGSRP
jgi:hypothetical protein